MKKKRRCGMRKENFVINDLYFLSFFIYFIIILSVPKNTINPRREKKLKIVKFYTF